MPPKKYSPKYKKEIRHQSEEELYKKLFNTILAILVTIVLVLLTFKFLGPKIASIFGLISVNREQTNGADKVAPPAPIFSDAPKATNKETLKLNGITEAGAEVVLFVNGPVAETTTADSGGTFTFASIKLNKGKNTIFAKANDSAGNESPKSETLTVNYDTKKPEIEILEPKSGETISNLEERISVKGSLNEEARVTVNGRKAIVKADNTFEILIGVDEGEVGIKIEAEDLAGNKAVEEFTVTYDKG